MNAAALLHPAMQDALALVRSEFPGTLTSTFRSVAEQRKLWDDFRRGRSKFPAEQPGNSTHHTGLSFDFVVKQGSGSAAQRELGRWWRSLGGKWSERDVIHFEHPQARAVLNQGFTTPRWWL